MSKEPPSPPPSGRRFGYARVSTIGQTLEVQLAALREAGCDPIFQEKVSGARSDRKELARLLAKVGAGDEVVVTKIDRLSRSLMDLFSIVKRIDDAGGRFRSLDPSQAMADTGNTNGRLMLALMGWMADVERDMILARTADGKALKRAKGTLREGRPSKLTPAQQREALSRLDGMETLADIAASYNVSGTTIARLRDRRAREAAQRLGMVK